MSRFPRDASFDAQFAAVEGARWHPFIGKNFGEGGRRLMVYAHNIPIKPAEYDRRLDEWSAPSTWADAIGESTYSEKTYANAFRYFIKGAAGLKSTFSAKSETAITDRVDGFVNAMAYLNFIQGLVKSDKQLVIAPWEQVKLSKRVNREYLRILEITHCICWGTPTYHYVKSLEGYRGLSERSAGKRGFSSCVVETDDGRRMNVLRIFHPSMPQGFSPYSETTQRIIAEFLALR